LDKTFNGGISGRCTPTPQKRREEKKTSGRRNVRGRDVSGHDVSGRDVSGHAVSGHDVRERRSLIIQLGQASGSRSSSGSGKGGLCTSSQSTQDCIKLLVNPVTILRGMRMAEQRHFLAYTRSLVPVKQGDMRVKIIKVSLPSIDEGLGLGLGLG
jgi:hypothetical protein